jgi:predicted methyltransferase
MKTFKKLFTIKIKIIHKMIIILEDIIRNFNYPTDNQMLAGGPNPKTFVPPVILLQH